MYWKTNEETVWEDEGVNYAVCYGKIRNESWSLDFAMSIVSVTLTKGSFGRVVRSKACWEYLLKSKKGGGIGFKEYRKPDGQSNVKGKEMWVLRIFQKKIFFKQLTEMIQ